MKSEFQFEYNKYWGRVGSSVVASIVENVVYTLTKRPSVVLSEKAQGVYNSVILIAVAVNSNTTA
jgi:hypothetical protein